MNNRRQRLAALTLAAATAWCGPGLASAAEPPTRRPRQDIYQELLTRHTAVSQHLAATDRRIQEVEALLRRYDIDPADLAQLIRRESATLEQLRLTVAELERLLAEKEELLKVDLEAPRQAIAQALAARDNLLAEESALRRELQQAEPEAGLNNAVSLEGMESRPFLLTGDRIAPFSTPYFSYRMIKVRLQDRRVVDRRRYARESDAGAIADAVQPGGVLHTLVNSPEFDRGRTYVTLWVCADAIDGYYTVIDFLRRADVRYSWQTEIDQPWTATDEESPLENWGYEG